MDPSRPKHKAACDQCNASKVKCPGGAPPCKRCANSSQPCHYSLAKRTGKPPGCRNRKTLEKLRQAKEEHPESNSSESGVGESSIIQINVSRDHGDGALDVESERREDNASHGPLQMSATTDFWPLSPLMSYPILPDTSQSLINPNQDPLDGDHVAYSNGRENSDPHPTGLNLPDFEELGSGEPRRPWTDAQDNQWDAPSPRGTQQLPSDRTETHSPLSPYSYSTAFETDRSVSLDTVASRLEETAGLMITQIERQQPTLCQCLRKYADVLCKLQNIEKRQRPVQVDTLLTSANLVLDISGNQMRCTQCMYDSCVAMQLVMIFQTIFSWSQGQSHSLGTPAPDLRGTLGQHEMTEEECRLVKVALISKALEKATALLRLMMSRIEQIVLNRQAKQSWSHDGVEFWNLQQYVSSLIQSFGILLKRFASEQSRSHQGP